MELDGHESGSLIPRSGTTALGDRQNGVCDRAEALILLGYGRFVGDDAERLCILALVVLVGCKTAARAVSFSLLV